MEKVWDSGREIVRLSRWRPLVGGVIHGVVHWKPPPTHTQVTHTNVPITGNSSLVWVVRERWKKLKCCPTCPSRGGKGQHRLARQRGGWGKKSLGDKQNKEQPQRAGKLGADDTWLKEGRRKPVFFYFTNFHRPRWIYILGCPRQWRTDGNHSGEQITFLLFLHAVV